MNSHALGEGQCPECVNKPEKEKTGSFSEKVWAQVYSFFFFVVFAPIALAAPSISKSNQESSYSLDLVGDDHGVLLADLGSSFGFVVVRTVVLVGVAVDSTEQVPTAAVKAWKARAKRREAVGSVTRPRDLKTFVSF